MESRAACDNVIRANLRESLGGGEASTGAREGGDIGRRAAAGRAPARPDRARRRSDRRCPPGAEPTARRQPGRLPTPRGASTSRPSRACGPASSSTCAPARSSARIGARTAPPDRSSCSTRPSRPPRRRCPSSSERPTRRCVAAVRVRRADRRSCASRSGSTWTYPPPKPPWSRRTRRSSGWPVARSPRASSRLARCAPSSGRRAVRSMPRRPKRSRPRSPRSAARVAYVSTSAPLVFVDLPSDGVAALAERPEVLSLGLEQGWRTFMSSAGVTVGANWTGGSGDQGNGVRVAVVEYANVVEHRRPRRPGRGALQHERNDRDAHPSDVGRGRDRQQELHVAGRCAGRRHRQRRHREFRARAVDRPRRHRRHRLGDLAERRRRRHRQHELRPGHRHWRRRGSTLLRLRRLGGQPAGRRVERQLLDLRELERRLTRDRLQRAHRGRGQRPQHRQHRRRRPLVFGRTARATATPTGPPGTRTAITTSRTCRPRPSACERRTARSATGRASRARSSPASALSSSPGRRAWRPGPRRPARS